MKMLWVVVLGLCFAASTGCGGSGSNSGGGGNNTPTLTSIQISPATPTINSGATQQFTATGTYSDGSTQNLTTSANWLSSATNVATITTGGLATGVGGGTTTISASVSGLNSTTTLTVVALQSITVSPSSATVVFNGTQQYTATGNYSDGSTQNLTTSVTWTATNGVTITSGGLAKGTVAGNSTITATSGAVSGTAALVVTNPLQSIVVSPSTVSVAPNATQQFTATGTYADGSQHVLPYLTDVPTWSASTGGSIDQSGLATGITPNATVTIQAAVGSVAGSAIMTVTNPLTKIAVTPANPQLAPGTNQQFTATGTYADNTTQVLTSSVTWASSNTSVATISNSPGTQGFASALTSGTTTISATSGSVVGTTTLTVTSATLVSIAVTPSNPQITYQTQQQFTATGTFDDSTTQDITRSVTWASSDTAHITITPTTGLATGVATTTSPVTISATQSSVSGSTTATVVPASVTSIAITPATNTLAAGTSRQYTATATLANGSTQNYTTLVSWTSSSPSAATVGLHTGLVKGTATGGTTIITATYNGVSSNFTLSVNVVPITSITLTPSSVTIPAGVPQKFNAIALFGDGTTQDISLDAAWSSSDTSVATVNLQGLALSVAAGTATISATLNGASGMATLNVDTSTLLSISVAPAQTVLPVGKTVTYNAYGTYSNGKTYAITNQATWTSSDTTVVSVSPVGVASTIAPGPASISAAYQGVTSTSGGSLIVTAFPLVKITVAPSSATVPVGVGTQFAATGTFSDGSTQPLTAYATWAANPASVATINNPPFTPGLATGVSPGTAGVTAVFAGVVNTQPSVLTVTNATIMSIAVSPSNPSVANGAQVQFTATGTFSDGSQINLTNQVNWSSSDVTVATIANTGLCTTVKPGTALITASFNGVSGTANLTVN